MNNDHAKAKWNETKGKIKEEVGHATGNNKKTLEGVADQIKGKVQKAVGDAKDSLKQKVDNQLNRIK